MRKILAEQALAQAEREAVKSNYAYYSLPLGVGSLGVSVAYRYNLRYPPSTGLEDRLDLSREQVLDILQEIY